MTYLKFLRSALTIIGALTIVGISFLAIAFAFDVLWQKPTVDSLKPKDVMFVLNSGDIGKESKIVKILHSYESTRSLTGDHVDAYSIQIDRFPESVLMKEYSSWVQGPIVDPILIDAIDLSSGMATSDGLGWFPATNELNSGRYYLLFHTVYLYNRRVNAAQLIAYDRDKKILYYADVKM